MRTCLLLVGLALFGCGEPLDRSDPSLPRPQSLPAVGEEPVVPSVAGRAVQREEGGRGALERNDLKEALAAFTEACHLDPSMTAARVGLARVYVRAGLGSVALELFEAWRDAADRCGPCLEGLLVFAADPEFAKLRDHERGAALVAAVAGKGLPWERWGAEAAMAFATPKPGLLERYTHPAVPYTLSRVCPDCPNPERRVPEERTLQGFPLLAKVASRFDGRNPLMGGIPLQVPGSPRCEARCCRFTLPDPLPVGGAVLSEVCFRPLTPETAALTRLALVYGRSKTPDEAKPPAE